MSAENEALTRRWFDEVWNAKSAGAVTELLAADAVAHGMGPNGTDVRGPAQFLAVQAAFCGAFPDLHIVVDPIVANGDMVAAHFLCTATHLGDHLGIPATGRPVKITGMTIIRYKDRKIVEGWNCIDLMPVAQLAGAAAALTNLP